MRLQTLSCLHATRVVRGVKVKACDHVLTDNATYCRDSAQTHEGLPVVDSSGQPTKKVHAFGPKWQALYASEYDSVVFQNPTLKCAAPCADIMSFSGLCCCAASAFSYSD